LLAGSPQLAELNRLESEARSAQDKASAKERELNALWSEFQNLPVRSEHLRRKLGNIAAERGLVESEEKLIESYKPAYRLWMDTQTPRSASEMRQAATLLVERDLRLQVLDALTGEINAEMTSINEKNQKLAKSLAVRKHDLK